MSSKKKKQPVDSTSTQRFVETSREIHLAQLYDNDNHMLEPSEYLVIGLVNTTILEIGAIICKNDIECLMYYDGCMVFID